MSYDYLAPNYLPNQQVVLTKGQGALVWDMSGNCYIDMIAGYSAANQGHCHPRIQAALIDQAKRLTLCPRSWMNDQLGLFAKKLCKLTGMDMMLPSSGGAESVETAIKIARRWGYQVKKIPKEMATIVVFHNNFHGRTTTIVSFSSHADARRDFTPRMQGFISIPYGDYHAIENLLNLNPHICAVLVEPVQGEAGVILPPRGWLKHVEILCDRFNSLLILDEIQSGFGRTGKMFAMEHENIYPHMIIVGKSLGGGMLPISAVAGRKAVMEVMDPGSHGSTFGGNPLAAAVAIEAMQVIEDEKLVDKSRDLGKHLEKRLCAIQNPLIKAVRCIGLWAGVEIDTTQANPHDICERLFDEGVMTKEAHNAIRLSPPLVITKFQLDQAIDKIEETLKDLSSCRTS